MNHDTAKLIQPGDWVIFDSPKHNTFLEGKVKENSAASIFGTRVLSVEVDLTTSSRNHNGQFYTVSRELSTLQIKPKQITSWVKKN